MFEKIKELSDELTKARTEYQQKAKSTFKEALTEFFAAYPDVLALRWNQYAPYFNDGEPCTFSVNEPELAYSAAEADDRDVDDEDEEFDFTDSYDDYSKAATTIGELFGMLDNDTMEAAFGSDSQITVKRDGSIDVDSYGDHD